MVWTYIIVMVVTLVLGIALAPKPQGPKSAALDDFDFPTAEEGRPIPVVFGQVDIRGSNILWYGNLKVKKIKKSGLFSSTTVGFKYYIDHHAGLCHGPVDEVNRILIGEKWAWAGNITSNATININFPSLFGGQKREGGVVGAVAFMFGGSAQTANAYLAAQTGSSIAYRGIFSYLTGSALNPFYIGTTAYPKVWAVRVVRIVSGWYGGTAWYAAKAVINLTLMNPAHIIYQCLTDPRWGMGVDTAQIDNVTFTAMADKLYDEGFGLAINWNQSSSIEEFIEIVCDHIAGGLTLNSSTGKYELVLVRGDYDIGTLPTYDEQDIIALTDYQRQAWGETTNEVTLVYTDPTTGKDTAITQQDLANIDAQGVRVAQKIEYKGIRDNTVARTVLARELASRVTPLSKITFEINRRAWSVRFGDLFKLNWTPRNINGVVYRVIKISKGTLQKGAIRIEALEDIYALGINNYLGSEAAPGVPSEPATPDDSADTGSNVVSTTASTPPGSPIDGDTYFIPLTPAATGAWAGHEGEFATWDSDNAEWLFADVPDHTLIYDQTASEWYEVNAGVAGVTPWIGDAPVDGQQYARKNAAWEVVVGGGGGGGPGGSMGALAFVGEAIVTGAAATDLTISGLNLNTDDTYVVHVETQNVLGTTPLVSLYFNADFTATNYDYQRHSASSATNNSATGNTAEIITAFPASPNNALLRMTIAKGLDGAPVALTNNYLGTNGGNPTVELRSVRWRTAGVNVTSLTLRSATANAFAIGSRIRVWKMGIAGTESACVLNRVALQTFSTTAQAVIWDTETVDTENYWSVVNPTRITFPVAGWYNIAGGAWQSGDADDMHSLWLAKNGAAYALTQLQTRLGAGSTAIAAGSQVVTTEYYEAGDYVELYVDNRTGTSTCYAQISVIRMSGPTGPQGATGPAGFVGTGVLSAYAKTDQSKASDTTLASDPVLQVPLEANKTYRVQADIYIDSSATPDFKCKWDFGGTVVACLNDSLHAAITTASLATSGNTTTQQDILSTDINVIRTFALGGTDTIHLRLTLTLEVGTTGGTLAFQWAQNTSSATACVRRKGSAMFAIDMTATSTATIDTEIAADTPYGYWKLDEASGNFADSSGNARTLTLVGSPVTQYQFAAMDPKFPTRKTAAILAGSQSAHIGNSALGLSFPLTTYTMEVWGAFTVGGALMGIGANGETLATNFSGLLTINTGGVLELFWEYATGTDCPACISILGGTLDGKLHHIACVKDGTARTVAMYIDGRYVGGLSTYTVGQEHTGGTSNLFSIAGGAGSSNAGVDGVWSGAAFYTTALSETRIQAHARALGLFK